MPRVIMKVGDDLVIFVSLQIQSEVPDKKCFLNENTPLPAQLHWAKKPNLSVRGRDVLKNTTLKVR